jgi:hypothetical protein
VFERGFYPDTNDVSSTRQTWPNSYLSILFQASNKRRSGFRLKRTTTKERC